jgi:hypothetical protein
MREKSRIIVSAAILVLLAAVVAGVRIAPHAAADGKTGASISPFDIMLKSDMTKLPLEEFKDGECPARC